MYQVQSDIRSTSVTDVIYTEMMSGTLLYVRHQDLRNSAIAKLTYLTASQQISYIYGIQDLSL